MAFVPISLIALLLHVYIGVRLCFSLDSPVAIGAMALWLVLSAVTMPLAMSARGMRRQDVADRISWVGMLFMGLFSNLLVLTLLRDAMLLAARAGAAWSPALASLFAPYDAIAGVSARAVPLLAIAVTAYGILQARRTARVRRVDVPIDGLPTALQGFTIAQVSDVHVGPTIKRAYVERIAARVSRLEADMVALTGDLVDGAVAALAVQIAPLGTLRSRHGTFFVTGNHEYYSGAPAWTREFGRMGMKVLSNEHVVIEHDGARLVAAGVNDFNAGHFDSASHSDPAKAMHGAPADAGVRVLLAHQPRSAPEAARAGFDLQISGHTHGGQFWPWNLFVPLQQPYVHGLHRLERLWIYVSRGTGYWGPPMRFGAPSEITLLRLVLARARSAPAGA